MSGTFLSDMDTVMMIKESPNNQGVYMLHGH